MPTNPRPLGVDHRRYPALFLVLAAVWGTAFMAIKAGLEYFPPVLFAAIRYDLAALLLLAYVAGTADDWLPRTRADWAAVAASGFLMIAAYNALLFVGEQGTTSAIAAIIVSLIPLLTTGFARAFLPAERLSPLGALGILLGLLGVAIVARPDPSALLAGDLFAEALVLTAAASAALGSVLVQRADPDFSTEGLVACSMLVGALVMHGVSFVHPEESFAAIRWEPGAFWALAYLAVFASALGYLVYFDLLKRLGSVEINLVAYVVPVFAALSGWLVLDETIDGLTVVGFLVIVAGFVLLKRRALARRFARARL